MNENKKSTAPDWDDDAPDLSTPEWQEKMAHAVLSRGRPRSASPKELVSLRLDADVLTHFKQTGPGWQTRINSALRKALVAKNRKSA